MKSMLSGYLLSMAVILASIMPAATSAISDMSTNLEGRPYFSAERFSGQKVEISVISLESLAAVALDEKSSRVRVLTHDQLSLDPVPTDNKYRSRLQYQIILS